MFRRPPFLCVSFACLYGIGCDGGEGIFSVRFCKGSWGFRAQLLTRTPTPKNGETSLRKAVMNGETSLRTPDSKKEDVFFCGGLFPSAPRRQFDVVLEVTTSPVFCCSHCASCRSIYPPFPERITALKYNERAQSVDKFKT